MSADRPTYVIVGGVAGGMSAATRLRRLDEHARIVVVERSGYVSFANCGLPYHVGGVIEERSALLLQTPASLGARFGLEVHVLHYDRAPKTIDGDFAVIWDGIEATVVSSAPARILEGQRTDRGMEGPFAAIRLEISESFGADGFIATATGACAAAGVGVYLLSTFSFDYVFVAPERLDVALDALAGAGFPVAGR